jgi:hypothetical protein
MQRYFLVSLFLITFNNTWAAQRIRHIEVKGDEIVTIRTSIGIATLIQVPDSPNSVVVGDQESFKVEYLDRAITIKPLTMGGKSNLYVYTEWKRFNVELISGPQGSADYVVYLELPKVKKKAEASIVWTNFRNVLKNDNLTLETKRLGLVSNGMLLVEFVIKASTKETFKPEWIWLSQNGEVRPIHGLVLSSLKISPSSPATGLLQLKRIDLSEMNPLKLELRRKKTSFLTITKVNLWKQ